MPKFPRTIEGLIERYREQGPIPVLELMAMLPLQPEPPLQFNSRELATVLAALRHYQESGFGDMTKLPERLAEIAVDGESNRVPLDDSEIDALCERLNGVEEYEDIVCPSCHGLTENCGRCRGMGTVEQMIEGE